MPTRMTSRFSIKELAGLTLSTPFTFSKGLQLLKLRPKVSEEGEPLEVQGMSFEDTQSQLYDVNFAVLLSLYTHIGVRIINLGILR